MRRTKIVCTIGPACSSEECLRRMIGAGMNVARLNFSHGSHEDHAEKILKLRQLSSEMGLPIGIMQDLSGPKIRAGKIASGSVCLTHGQDFTFTSKDVPGDEHGISLPYPGLLAQVKPGDTVFADDAKLQFTVTAASDTDIATTVVIGGELSSNKGVCIPGTRPVAKSATSKDLKDLRFGISQGVDWIAQSFCTSPDDRAPLDKEMEQAGVKRPIIAKIERPEAVQAIDAMIEAYDGIMIARGDLGIELPICEVPIIQKMIIEKCNAAGKPVITATQMLDSMMYNARPTRAEATDVANAILDGTDATMLSGETAVGDFPVESVNMMDHIALETEASGRYSGLCREKRNWSAESITEAIGQASAELAADLNTAAIITCTATGATAMLVSKFRPQAPIVATASRPDAVGKLMLSWGVFPISVPESESTDELIYVAVNSAKSTGLVKQGDAVVVTAGVPVGFPGNTSLIRVLKVK